MRRTEIKYRGVDDGTLRNFRCIEELEDTVRDYESEIGLLGESALESYWLFCTCTKSKGIRPITKECFYYQIHRITGYSKKKVNTKFDSRIVYTNEKLFDFMDKEKEPKAISKDELQHYLCAFNQKYGVVGKNPTAAHKEFCTFLEENGFLPIEDYYFFWNVRRACNVRTKRIRKDGGLLWVYTTEKNVGR